MEPELNTNGIIYLDSHATTPVHPEVLEAMLPYFKEHFGNASSSDHIHGVIAARAVETAREQVASTINAEPKEIIFTSGATESDNLAIFGVVPYHLAKGKHIITSTIEHKAIMECCEYFEQLGGEVTYLDVNTNGVIDYSELESSIKENTVLVSLFAANNEVGSIHDLKKIGDICKNKGVVFHTDAVQLFGRQAIDVREMNIGLMSLSAHKIYGPKGVGALFVRKRRPRVQLTQIIRGGGQEFGLRSGTLNVPGIVGFGKAVELICTNIDERTKELVVARDYLWQELKTAFPKIELNGSLENRLPHNLNIYFPDIDAKLIIQLLRKKLSISAGSACTTDVVKPSHVISKMYDDENRAFQSIRIGLSDTISQESINIIKSTIELNLLSISNNI
jgi:cysteine desulfurase